MRFGVYFCVFTGISPDEIVKVSSKYYEKQEQSFSKGNRVRIFFFGISQNQQCFCGIQASLLNVIFSQLAQNAFVFLLYECNEATYCSYSHNHLLDLFGLFDLMFIVSMN